MNTLQKEEEKGVEQQVQNQIKKPKGQKYI